MKHSLKRLTSACLAMLMLLQLFPAAYAAVPAEQEEPGAAPAALELDGLGTEEDPYLISDAGELVQAIEAINGGGEPAEAYYQLDADISLDGESVPSIESFSGTLDGAGHAIDGYTLSGDRETDALVRENRGTIRALALTDVEVTGPNTAETSRRAGLCFQNHGTIEECYVTGSVSGGHRSGGIVAENYDTIQNCYFVGNVTGRCESGGITAWCQNTAKVLNCYVEGDIATQTNNSGIIGGYGYTGTVYQGNVVLSGSTLSSVNDWNHARICGRNNGDTTFTDNLSCSDVTVNGSTVSDGAANNLQGADKTAEELRQQETYESIGWDFETVWVMDENLGRPALRSCREAIPEEKPDQVSYQVESPNGELVATVYVDGEGQLGYTVSLNGTTVLERATLGLTVDGVELGKDAVLGGPVQTTLDETYETRGMHTQARNHYNQSAFPVTSGGASMTLNVRAYDDGIAIQYDLPEGEHTVSGDDTRFALPTNATAFYQYGDGSNYEGIKNMQVPTETSSVAGIGVGRLLCTLPTFELADEAAYVCITEANIYDWSGMGLRTEGSGVLKAEYWDDNGKTFVTGEDSPWRLAIIADNLNDFANSDMVTNVSDPMDEELFSGDTSWIQPGRSVWTTQGGGSSTIAGYKEYSDYASQLGIEFNLIEGRDDFGGTLDEQFAAIKEIVDYSAALENPVKIWLWEDAPTTRYDGGLYTEENARDFLQRCKDAGVVGVKIDHIHSESPDKVSFYEDFTRLAAEYQIMVSYHNPMKPTGLSRTYPNEMTREAIRGMQYQCNPNENAILPFTRLLAGSADYTPMNFSNGSKLGSASWTHMLANTVIMTSSYLQLSENPKNMIDQVYTDFIKVLPTVWDETIVLDQSEIGEAAAFLRRSGDEWYLAVQNAAHGSREMTFDLDFLGEGTWYADIYYDSMSSAAQIRRQVKQVTSADQLEAQIRSGGGYVVRLTQDEIHYETDAGKVFEISTAEDLDLIREHPDADFNVTADIQLTGEFEPIPTLNGTLNGNGHTISGLTVTSMDAAAAFILQNNGTIRQLGLTNVYMEGPYTADNSWRAALCQRNYGIIEECYALGTITGGHRNGGLVSENYNTIRNCYFMGDLESNFETGGITSFNYNGSATVENCYAAGDYVSRNNNMGFISGYAYSGTRMIGNVALSGSLQGNNNLARICGRNNGVNEGTTYQNNLACADITVNGQSVNDGAANNKNGQNKSADELKQQSTYEDIGWDFTNVWTMGSGGRPVLKNVPEVVSVDASATQIDGDTVWSYLDDGTDPAAGLAGRTEWAQPDFDDSAWKTAAGSFGAKNGSTEGMDGGYAIHTLLDQYKEDGDDKEAYFFRTTVTVPDASAVQQIVGSLLYDDAATVYLNGTRVAGFDDEGITENLQYGGSNAAEPKTGSISLSGEALDLLVDGENTIAVELHQGRADSSDIYFDFLSLDFETEAPLFSGDMEWKYLDDNTDPAAGSEDRTSWTAEDFDDSAWKTAAGPFGSKRGEAELESGYTANTVLNGCDGSNDYYAYFFRTTFSIPSLEGMTKLVGTLQHDDGVIVYINGVRVAAFDDVACDDGGNSLGHGFDANLQYGGANASTPKTDTFTLTDLSMLKEGENTIAVELHNGRRTSSDVWFHFTGLSLSAEAIQVDFSDLSLSVGADESQRNLTWYATDSNPGYVLVAKESELTDGQMPETASRFDARSSLSDDGGKYSNQSTISGLEDNTVYAYQMVNSGVRSGIYTFTTGDSSDGTFSFAYAGDPQIGAGSTASDIEGWDKTLGLVAGSDAFEGIEFLLSAGDQVNTASDENQYNGYLEHEALYSLPVATVVGNHDSSSAAYSQHFNEPNNSRYGATNASSDYYFVYGGVLFMVLNSNNMSTAEHKAFLEEAIAATADQDIQWKVVTFHHSIYSVANHATEGDILQRRDELVPVFEELDIDVVLQGHDHVYVRTYMMDGFNPITESDKYTYADGDDAPEAVTDPDGILYVTANSASGSKYYEIQNMQFPYAAVKDQGHTPNISRVDVTDNSFTITTYRTSDMSVVDTFTINRTAEEPEPEPEEPLADGFANGENSLDLTAIGRYTSGQFSVDGGVMEIVAYNSANQTAYAVNGQSGLLAVIPMDALERGDTMASLDGGTFDVKAAVEAAESGFRYGDMTSVAVSPDGTMLAAALQAQGYADTGRVALFTCGADGSLTLSKVVEVGVQPDMVTFADNGTVLTADEGEPREGYGGGIVDPKGSVSVVDVAAGVAEVVTFDSFDSRRDELVSDGIVIKKDTAPSVDFEPEYLAVSCGRAYVTLQENNAIAVLDIEAGTFTGVYSAGFEDYSTTPVDIDKKDETYVPATYESLMGIRMPDGIAAFEADGRTYLVTANEGDAREWGDEDLGTAYLNEDERNFKDGGDTSPTGAITAENSGLEGKVVFFLSGDYDGLDESKDYLFGGRSFTLYEVNGDGITEVFTSGGDFEALTYQYLPEYYNSSNDNAVLDDRSGKKGPEPESVTVGEVEGRTYAFVALERTGGIMVYDITDPAEASFVNYINSRRFDTIVSGSEEYEDGELDKWVTGGDVAPEGLAFVPAGQNHTGKDLLLAACEVSGTVAVYELTGRQVEEPEEPDDGGSSGGSSSSRYAITASAGEGGSISPSGTVRVERGDSQTFTIRAEEGYEISDVLADGRSVGAVSSYTFENVRERHTIRAVFTARIEDPDTPLTDVPFTDVPADAWYAQPVQWAVENGITSGTGAGTFSPDMACTRAQIVTFLWQAAGRPQPAGSGNPFADVKESDYFYTAVLWAVEQGITAGVSEDSFAPYATVTRGQTVTFLYRAAGSPAVTEGSSFADVEDGAWYADAVAWAAAQGITAGVSADAFGPNASCTRAQIVTFLYRFMEQ